MTYCSVHSRAALDKLPVRPVYIGALVRWDRKALDRWLDGLMGDAPSSPPAANDTHEDDPDAALQGYLDHRQPRETPRRP